MDEAEKSAKLTVVQSEFLTRHLGFKPDASEAVTDIAALKSRLSSAVAQMQNAPPDQAGALSGMAKSVAAALKSQDSAKASAELDALEAALATGMQDQSAETLLPVWIEAKEEADKEIDALSGALRGSGLPIFERIADAGLHAITQGQFVALHTALMNYDRAKGPAQGEAVGPARKAVEAMRVFLTSEPAVGLIEKNPFGVPVTLRGRLGSALAEIDARLDT